MVSVLARFTITPLAWRLAFLYAALFLVVCCYLPYMPVWLHWRGLDADAIALLLAAPLFARVLFHTSHQLCRRLDGGSSRRPHRSHLGIAPSFLLLGSPTALGTRSSRFCCSLLLATTIQAMPR